MVGYFRFFFDSGLLILIVIVQLIIYPSFIHHQPKRLLIWHSIYTKKIALIVLPLMLGQLCVAMFQVYQNQNLDTVLYSAIVLFLWGITFTKFAPMHGQISNGRVDKEFLQKLVRLNWIRTTLWFMLFLLTIRTLIDVNRI
tara:strand:- start:267 stop:689 length:423 start_codon:yes stop_codon:yes gene_type:complete